MRSRTSRYLLDTHVFLWLVLGDTKLKPARRKALEMAAVTGGLFVSPITCWEIATLAARGRVQLGMPCQDWMKEALGAPGLSILEFSPHIAVEAADLPGPFHGDPADRMIVACARIKKLILATRDEKILSYAEEGYVSVLAC